MKVRSVTWLLAAIVLCAACFHGVNAAPAPAETEEKQAPVAEIDDSLAIQIKHIKDITKEQLDTDGEEEKPAEVSEQPGPKDSNRRRRSPTFKKNYGGGGYPSGGGGGYYPQQQTTSCNVCAGGGGGYPVGGSGSSSYSSSQSSSHSWGGGGKK